MPGNVDVSIAELQFNGKQFEEGVAQSLRTIEKLDTALQFKDADKGFSNVTKAAEKVSFAPISDAIDSISTKLNTLTTGVGRKMLEIKKKIVDGFENAFKEVTIKPAAEGWAKYADKATSVGTMMSATRGEMPDKSDEERMAYITDEMQKLNWFTDETSYSFTDMTQNIGKFTNMGIPLKDSVTAMEGIATWAGISGANVQEASRAMYNMSQAMGVGKVTLIDWKSIENANMATKEFKEMALQAAAARGTLEDLGNGQYNNGKAIISVKNFTEEMTNTGWFTADVLTDVLKNYGNFTDELYNLSEEVNQNEGMYFTTSELIKMVDQYKAGKFDINGLAEQTGADVESLRKSFDTLGGAEMDLGRRSFAASQEARTFGQAMDSIKDATSTAWMNTYENIFGNYMEAKGLWTDMSNELYDVFAEPLNGLNDSLAHWKERGGRDTFISSIWTMWDTVKDVGGSIFDGIGRFVPELNSDTLINFTNALQKFVFKIQPSEKDLENLSSIFAGLTAIVTGTVGTLKEILKPVAGFAGPLVKELLDWGGALGEFISHLMEYSKKVDAVHKAFKNLGEWFSSKIPEPLKELLFGKKVTKFEIDDFGNVVETVERLTQEGLVGKLGDIFGAIKDGLRNFKFGGDKLENFSIFTNIADAIINFGNTAKTGLSKLLTDALDGIKGKIGDFTLWFFSKAKSGDDDILSKICSKLYSVIMSPTIKTITDKIATTFKTIKDLVGGFKDWFFQKVEEGKNNVLSSIFDLVKSIVDGTFLSTVKEKFDTFVGNIKEFISNFSIVAYVDDGTVVEQKSVLSTIMDHISSFVNDKFPKVKKALGDALDYAKDKIEKFKDFIFGKQSKTYDHDELGNIVETIQRHTETGLLSKIKSGLDSLKGHIKNFFDGVNLPNRETIVSGLKDSWEKVSSAVTNFVGNVDFPKLSDIADKIKDFFKKIKDIIFGKTETVDNSYVDEAGRLIDNLETVTTGGVISKLVDAFGKIKDAVEKLLKSVKLPDAKTFESVFNIIKSKITDTATKIKPHLPTWDDISTFLKNIKDRVVDFVTKLKPHLPSWESIMGFFTKLKDTVVDVAGKIKPYLPTWDDIIAFLKKIPEGIKEMISNFSITAYVDEGEEGTTQTITKSFDDKITVLEKTKEFIGKAWDVMQQIFRIIGNIGSTLLDGIEEWTSQATFDDYASGASKIVGTGKTMYVLGTAGTAIRNISRSRRTIADAVKVFADNTGGIKTIFDNAATGVKGMFDGIGKIFDSITGFVDNHKNLESNQDKHANFIETIKTLGTVMLEVGGTFALIAGSLYAIGEMDIDKMNQALGVITGIGLSLGGAVAVFATVPTLPITLKTISDALLKLSASLIIFAAGIAIFHTMNWDTVLDGVGKLSTLLGSLVIVAGLANKIGGNLDALGGDLIKTSAGILIMAFAVEKFSGLTWDEMIKGLVGVGGVLTELVAASVILNKFTGTNLNNLGSLIGLAIGLLALSVAVDKFAGMSWEELVKGVIGVGSVLAELVGMTVIISKFGGANGVITHILTVAALVLLMEEIARVFDLMAKYDMPTLLTISGSIGVVLGSLTGSIAILGTLPISSLLQGAIGLLSVVGIIGAIAFAIGDADPGGELKPKVEKGFELIQAVLFGIGKSFGDLVGGFLEGITDGLPGIATNLTSFMNNASGFFDGISKVPDDAVTKASTLASAMLTFAAADFVELIVNLLNNGESTLPKFASNLSSFALKLIPFMTVAAGVSSGAITSAENLSKLVKTITTNELITGIVDFVNQLGGTSINFKTGEISMGKTGIQKFGDNIVELAKALSGFSTEVEKGNINQDAVDRAVKAGELLAALEEKLPGTGLSVKTIWWGEQKWSTITDGLVDFGKAMVGFSKAITGGFLGIGGGINADAIDQAANSGKLLAELENELPASGDNLKTFLVGQREWSTISNGLINFGKAMKGFSDAIIDGNGIDHAAVESAVESGKLLAGLENELPAFGGVKTFWLGGQSWDTISGGLEQFGKEMVKFSTAITSNGRINKDAVENATQAGKMLAELEAELPTYGGLLEFFTGHKQDLIDFSTGISSLSIAMTNYSNTAVGLDKKAVDNMTGAIQTILGLEDYNGDSGYFSFSYLLGNMVKEIEQEGPKLITAVTEVFTTLDEAGNNPRTRIQNGMEEVMKGVIDAIEAVFATNGEGTLTATKAFENGLENLIVILSGQKMRDFKTAAADFFKEFNIALGEAFSGSGEATGIKAEFKSKVGELYSSTNPDWTGNLASFSVAAGNFFNVFLTAMNLKFDTAETGITATFGSKITALITKVEDETPTMLTASQGFITAIEQALTEIEPSITANFGNMISMLLYKVTSSTEPMHNVTTVFTNQLNQSMGELKPSIELNFGSIISGILSKVTGNTQSMQNVSTGFINTMNTSMTNLSPSIGINMDTILTNLVGAVTGKTPEMSTATTTFASKIGAALDGHKASAELSASTIAQNLVNIFTNKQTDMSTSGGNFIQGFINGLSTKSSSLYETVKNVATNTVNKLKETLGIHSPSTVTAEMGENLVAGFSVGIDGNNEAAMKSAVALADNMTAAMQKAVDTVHSAKAPMYEAAVETFRMLEEGMKNTFPQALETLETFIQTSNTMVQNGHARMIVSAYMMGMGIVRGLQRTRKEIFTEGIVISTYLEKYLADGGYQAGISFIESIEAGISAKRNSLLSMVSSLASDIARELQLDLGEYSNSATQQIADNFSDDAYKNIVNSVADKLDYVSSDKYIEPEVLPVFDYTKVNYEGLSPEPPAIDYGGYDIDALTSSIKNQTTTADALAAIESQVKDLTDKVANAKVVLDSGELVGGLKTEVDQQLGALQLLRERGN